MKLLALVGLVALACSAPAPTPTPTPAATATQIPAATLPPTRSGLAPGRYFQAIGSLTVYFTVGDGWVHQQSATDFFDIEQDVGSPDVIAVQFAGVTQGADTAVSQVEHNGDLLVSARQEIDLDCGLSAIRLTVEPVGNSDPTLFVPVITLDAGPISIAGGRRLQLDILNYHMGTAIIFVGGSIAHWEDALAAAQPVRQSLQLRPSGGGAC